MVKKILNALFAKNLLKKNIHLQYVSIVMTMLYISNVLESKGLKIFKTLSALSVRIIVSVVFVGMILNQMRTLIVNSSINSMVL